MVRLWITLMSQTRPIVNRREGRRRRGGRSVPVRRQRADVDLIGAEFDRARPDFGLMGQTVDDTCTLV